MALTQLLPGGEKETNSPVSKGASERIVPGSSLALEEQSIVLNEASQNEVNSSHRYICQRRIGYFLAHEVIDVGYHRK